MIDINNTPTEDLKNLRIQITKEISARTEREYEAQRNQRRKAERAAKSTLTESMTVEQMDQRRKQQNCERQRRCREAKKAAK